MIFLSNLSSRLNPLLKKVIPAVGFGYCIVILKYDNSPIK